MGITAATKVAGVIGRPARHSLSPLLHNAWLEAAGINGAYVALEATEEGFPHLIEGLRGGSLRGLNVTMPFKEAALAAADIASERAARAGSANVLVFRDDGLVAADNTDGVGLMRAFAVQAPSFDPAAAPVVVLGAGGAARGAAAALLAAGAPNVRLLNRTRARAQAIREALGEAVAVYDWADTFLAFSGAGAVVNATSLGLPGNDPLEVELTGLTSGAAVMDMVYRPVRTPFLARAAAAGHPIVDGLEMLIRQAEPAFAAFFGAPPPADLPVRGAILLALGEVG